MTEHQIPAFMPPAAGDLATVEVAGREVRTGPVTEPLRCYRAQLVGGALVVEVAE